MKGPDMSPAAVFKRLRLASELCDLCIELGRFKKTKRSSDNSGNSIGTEHETAKPACTKEAA